MSARAEPLVHLIDESFEEAVFLWSRWESDLTSISRGLDEAWIWTEDRLCGALDGVRIASTDVLERLRDDALSDSNPRKLTVCGNVLASARLPEARDLLGQVVATATGSALRALMRGIEVAQLDGSFKSVTHILSRQSPEHAAALASLKAFRRAPLSDELARAYESNVVELQVIAVNAASQLPRQYAVAWVDSGLKHEDPAVRLAAMQAGARHQVPNAWREILIAVREQPMEHMSLLPIVATLGSDAEHRLIYSMLSNPELQRTAIWSLGCIGTPEAAGICVTALKHAKLARVAAEAYCAITGADLARDRMQVQEPDEPTPDFENDDLDANLVPSPHQQWPIPDADAVRKHWKINSPNFQAGVRYVRGTPLSVSSLMRAVETAPMLRRASYVFELEVRSAGKYDVETRGLRATQKQMMALSRTRLADAPG